MKNTSTINKKSTVYDIKSSNGKFWTNAGLTVSTDGIEVLGAPIGSTQFVQSFAEKRYSKISAMIIKLNTVAKSHPQQSFCFLNRSTKFKATYLARTIPNAHLYAKKYDESLQIYFYSLMNVWFCKLQSLLVKVVLVLILIQRIIAVSNILTLLI